MKCIAKSLLIFVMMLAVVPAIAQDKKVKPKKLTGDIGLIDAEKNYIIVVTKEGKLVTVEFNDKTKVTKYVPQKSSVKELNLGTPVEVTYKVKVGELESFEYKAKPKKGE